MFFDEDEDERFMNNLNPGLYHISRELYAYLGASPDSIITNPCDLIYGRVPTHTEDGIPIRKLYVSNLPPKTTRTELFGVFAQYGFIKSCWLRMGDKGPNRSPTPTYAFVTYSNPADAHKALKAPCHEKVLRGRNLRISPADSWHQPAQDADGRVRWKPCSSRPYNNNTNTQSTEEEGAVCLETLAETVEDVETIPVDAEKEPEQEVQEDEQTYNIMDILNRDCLTHILSYLPITDLIRSERVSKRWQSMVAEYIEGIRTFKTSWWSASPSTLTTAVLRRVLHRVGGSLARLHIDHHWSTLNDRTAHTVGKFCPALEELKVVGMHTKNWNPLIYGCKQLKNLAFVSCNKLTDSSLLQIVKNDSCIESLTVANNTHVTGLFLTGSNPPKLNSLAFYNCYSLQGTVLGAAIDKLPNLTTLKLDVCPVSMWKIVPLILNKLPKLEELSLSEFTSLDGVSLQIGVFCESLATLTELKVLNLSRNIYITNEVLKQVGQSCQKLESLNISACNARKNVVAGVGDAGVAAVCAGCRRLARLDVSYLAALTDAGLGLAARLPRLAALIARGVPSVSAAPFAAALQACPLLQEVDLCGCDGVSEEVAEVALAALAAHPRRLTLRLAATPASTVPRTEMPTHKLLIVNTADDLSNPQLRPDFVDRVFDDSSEDSFGDLYSHDDFREFFGADDELFMDDDDLDEYEGVYAALGQDIILLP